MNSKVRLSLVVVAVLAVAVGLGYYVTGASTGSQSLTLSGTIEATEIHLASQSGGRIQQVYAQEGDPIHTGQTLIAVYSAMNGANEKITAPIDGVVLERLYEPGELAAPGVTLMVIANLNDLTLKVYVPENRYGQVSLGQTYSVTVDSFPGRTFDGTVTHIADQAEFTPRNVQTVEGRQSTVFAVTLALAPSDGKLKPGMPADVRFQMNQ